MLEQKNFHSNCILHIVDDLRFQGNAGLEALEPFVTEMV